MEWEEVDFSYFILWVCLSHVKKHYTNSLELMSELCRFVRYLKGIVGNHFYTLKNSIYFSERGLSLWK